MEGLVRDLRHGARSLLRYPVITLVATLTLALGIGANTAIFSVVDGIMLRRLPYPEPDRLIAVWADYSERGGPLREWLSYPAFVDLRSQERLFDDVAIYGGWGPTLTGNGEATSLNGAVVSAGMFSRVLKIQPALGRSFTAEDDQAGAAAVVLVSHGLWTRAFGADPEILGRIIQLDGEPYTVIGVMPANFRPPFIINAEIWRPIGPTLGRGFRESRDNAILRGVARLRAGVSLQTARSQTAGLARRIVESHPEATGIGYSLFPLRDDMVASTDKTLRVLLAAVGFILLIACLNVANLLLARGAGRRSEFAVRAALGAGRGRIVRQLLTESVVLATLGGALGFMLAVWGTQALIKLAPAGTPRLENISVDLRVLTFSAAITLLSGIGFGLLPALSAGRSQLVESLKEGGRGGDRGVGGRRVQSALVVSQVALALTLLVGAGLLLRSFVALNAVDLGFQTGHRLSLTINLPGSRYGERERRAAFFTELLERVNALPGVEGAAATAVVPLIGDDTDVNFNIEGRPLPREGERSAVWYRRITPGYFDVMGIPLVEGRAFTPADDDAAPPVVIINQTLARRHFPDRSPIGQHINLNNPESPTWREIVGVARDVKNFGVRAGSRDALYLPYLQSPSLGMSIVVRVAGDANSMIRPVSREISAIDPSLAPTGMVTLDSVVDVNLAPDRFVTLLVSCFAALALLLAIVGLYSVVSYSVTRRLTEIGIRIALGAQYSNVVLMIVARSLGLVGIGVAIGVAGALFLTRLMSGLLFGVSATDPVTFVAVASLLTFVAFVAASIPARKAARLDAMTVLRME